MASPYDYLAISKDVCREVTMDPAAPPNIVVFGETGTGKSSVINLIAGRQIAETSSEAKGPIFQSQKYSIYLNSLPVNLWETSGLIGGEEGELAARQALTNVFELIRHWTGGVSMLVYCVRGPRIKETTIYNYKMFYQGLFQGEIPIVLVVTGLEQEDPMDAWWRRNGDVFQRQGMTFSGQACVTATRGKWKAGAHMFEHEYEESKEKTQRLVSANCRGVPWTMPVDHWMHVVRNGLVFFARAFEVPTTTLSHLFDEVLTEHLQFSEWEAQMFVVSEASDTMDQKHSKPEVQGDEHEHIVSKGNEYIGVNNDESEGAETGEIDEVSGLGVDERDGYECHGGHEADEVKDDDRGSKVKENKEQECAENGGEFRKSVGEVEQNNDQTAVVLGELKHHNGNMTMSEGGSVFESLDEAKFGDSWSMVHSGSDIHKDNEVFEGSSDIRDAKVDYVDYNDVIGGYGTPEYDIGLNEEYGPGQLLGKLYQVRHFGIFGENNPAETSYHQSLCGILPKNEALLLKSMPGDFSQEYSHDMSSTKQTNIGEQIK